MSSTIALVLFGFLIAAGGAAGGWTLHGWWARTRGQNCPGPRAAAQPNRRDSVPGREDQGPPSGPCNRTTFCSALQHRLAESRRVEQPLSIVLLRIDRQGVRMANSAVRVVGEFLIKVLRATDWVVPLDASNFAILLPDTRLVEAVRVAERLRDAVSHCRSSGECQRLNLTLSAGTAEAMQEDDCEAFLCRAEAAMEAAVQAGGNRSCCHSGRQVEPAVEQTI